MGDGRPADGLQAGHRQAPYDLRFDWGIEGLCAVAPGAGSVVIIDVLRFTSAVSVAVGRGGSVLPYTWTADDAARAYAARAYAARHGADLAGHREDGGWSLSPTDLTELPTGTRLVLPSPNGSTLAVRARDGAPDATVLAGCLRNASAVAAVAAACAGPVAVVAAGERWRTTGGPLRPSVEDLLGAGGVLRRLVEIGGRAAAGASPEARAAMAAFDAARGDLHAWLRESASGRELTGIGFDDDVEAAAAFDTETVAPVLAGAEFSGVSPARAGAEFSGVSPARAGPLR